MHIGCHLSVAKGYENMGRTALEIGADTFQFFTRSPRGGKAAKLVESDVAVLESLMRENGFGEIVAHAPYTINMASHKPQTWEFAKETMRGDLDRLEKLPCRFYDFHPGNHTGKGVEYGVWRMAEGLNEILEGHPEISKRPVPLETPNDLDGYKREIAVLRRALSGSKRNNELAFKREK